MTPTGQMSSGEVATLLQISIPTVNRRAKSGQLPVIAKAPGSRGAYIFDRKAVEALAAQRGQVSA